MEFLGSQLQSTSEAKRRAGKATKLGSLSCYGPEGLLNRKEETVNRKQGGIQLVSQGGSETCLTVSLL